MSLHLFHTIHPVLSFHKSSDFLHVSSVKTLSDHQLRINHSGLKLCCSDLASGWEKLPSTSSIALTKWKDVHRFAKKQTKNNILLRVDSLLGNDLETNNETTFAAVQQILTHTRYWV
jgi:hypothetical protein